ANRMVILPLKESFLGREDPTLVGRLLRERPGILTWAVAGWRRLHDRGRFEQPESGRPLLEELLALSSPVGQFVRECCRVGGPSARTPREELYTAYQKWCVRKGYDHPFAPSSFGAEVRAVVPGLGDAHPSIAGERVRCYTEIALKE